MPLKRDDLSSTLGLPRWSAALAHPSPARGTLPLLIGFGVVLLGVTSVIVESLGLEWPLRLVAADAPSGILAGVLAFAAGLSLLLSVRQQRLASALAAGFVLVLAALSLAGAITPYRPIAALCSFLGVHPGIGLSPGTSIVFAAAALGLLAGDRIPLLAILFGVLLPALLLPFGSLTAPGWFALPPQWPRAPLPPAGTTLFFALATGLVALGFGRAPLTNRRRSFGRQLLVGGVVVTSGFLCWNALRAQEASDAARGTGIAEWILVASIAFAVLLVFFMRRGTREARRAHVFGELANDRAETLVRSERLLDRIRDVSGLLSADLELRVVAQEVIDAATDVTGAKYGVFYCYSLGEDGAPVLLDVTSGAGREALAAFPRPRNLKTVGTKLSDRKAVRIYDLRTEMRGEDRSQLAVASYLAVPVVSAAYEVWGALCFGHPDPGVFSRDEERAARQLAAQFAVVVEKARLYQAERTARESASTASRAKDHFLALLGHELRNPLGSLRTALEVVRQNPSPETDAEMREIIDGQTQQMARLLDDLLDISRLNRGKLSMRHERLDLGRLVINAVDSKRAEIEHAGLRVVIHDPGKPLHVDADRTRINQVVQNILHNAIKFTDAGGEIHVDLGAERRLGVVSVRDTGCGISPEDQDAVFDAFGQALHPERREADGLGLGLHLARAIIEAHGGRVTLESAGRNQGTQVRFELPLKARPAAESPPADVKPTRRRRRVFIIDDHEATALTTCRLLELHGNTVEVAYDGTSGVAGARRFLPEVVICDLGLPDIDGYAVARRLRSMPETRSAHIYAVTGYSGDDVSPRAAEAGFDGYLLKPLDPGQLLELLH